MWSSPLWLTYNFYLTPHLLQILFKFYCTCSDFFNIHFCVYIFSAKNNLDSFGIKQIHIVILVFVVILQLIKLTVIGCGTAERTNNSMIRMSTGIHNVKELITLLMRDFLNTRCILLGVYISVPYFKHADLQSN